MKRSRTREMTFRSAVGNGRRSPGQAMEKKPEPWDHYALKEKKLGERDGTIKRPGATAPMACWDRREKREKPEPSFRLRTLSGKVGRRNWTGKKNRGTPDHRAIHPSSTFTNQEEGAGRVGGGVPTVTVQAKKNQG